MYKLNELKNTTKVRKTRKVVGRGIGSGYGKTSGRGEKGAGSRSGYKRRAGYEGGQFRLFMKVPIRGFSNAQFRRELDCVNLNQIEELFEDGDIVNMVTLKERGFISGPTHGLKILGNGEITKKVTIEADRISQSARDKLLQAKISFKILTDKQ